MLLLQNTSEIRFAFGRSDKIRGEAVLLCGQRGDACPCVCLCTVPLQLSVTLSFFFFSFPLFWYFFFFLCLGTFPSSGLADLHGDSEGFRIIH